jgi:hypothetical protein
MVKDRTIGKADRLKFEQVILERINGALAQKLRQ